LRARSFISCSCCLTPPLRTPFPAGASSLAKTKAPAWLSRPAGATLGFGGRLAQFTNSRRQLATGESVATGSVIISQVTTEPQLVQRSEAFEAAIRGGDREALAAFCADMEQRVGGGRGGEGPAGGEVWSAQQQGGGGGGV
jgi:protein transport protein SEC31